AYTRFRRTQPDIGTEILISVTNAVERLNKEVKRRADVVGIFPNEASITRLIGAVLLEQNDAWQTQNRYMMVDAFARIDTVEQDHILSISTEAA
ncbi:transposase, partial [uncultured Jannaschia sp.]|uniref:transposase n=1 Tax=uncultured Jannaschia sp. TaxID=293347 RepID=UPI002604316D